MFHERAALVGRGSRVTQSLARHALRTNDTLLHRITCSVGNPLSSFGSLALPKKVTPFPFASVFEDRRKPLGIRGRRR
jgi:hypothetical protein